MPSDVNVPSPPAVWSSASRKRETLANAAFDILLEADAVDPRNVASHVDFARSSPVFCATHSVVTLRRSSARAAPPHARIPAIANPSNTRWSTRRPFPRSKTLLDKGGPRFNHGFGAKYPP